MNPTTTPPRPGLLTTFTCGLLLAGQLACPAAAQPETNSAGGALPPSREDSVSAPARPAGRELPWLGLSAAEPPEVLVAQLGLEPGVGLVVEFVSDHSPAAQAGLRQHDLLVAFEDQPLVHPAQLRKLVQTRKEGDLVKLTYYRGGKRETATAKLGHAVVGLGLPGDELAWRGDLRELQRQLRDLPVGDEFQRRMEAFRETLSQHFGPERRKALTDQMREATEAARGAAHEALRSMTNAGLRELRQALEDLERDGVAVSRDARVTVHRSGSAVQTVVHSDDSGTYVLIADPAPRLTAHGREGKLLFDGPVATPEERAKVPPEIWEKVEPMLDKLATEPAPPAPPAKRGKTPAPGTF